MILIGLCSFSPQVGKTTCADYLKDNYNFITLEMSQEITKFCKKFLGYNGDKLDPMQRKILQDVGKLWKDHYPDIWLYHNLGSLFFDHSHWKYENSFKEYLEIKEIFKDGEKSFIKVFQEKKPSESMGLVISGIRSPEEANEIKRLGGRVFLVERNLEIEEKNIHAVENALYGYQHFDGLLINNSTKENYYKKIEKVIFKKLLSAIHIRECPYSGIEMPSYETMSEPAKKIIEKYNINFISIN